MSFSEGLQFFTTILSSKFNSDFGKETSVKQYLDEHNFSPEIHRIVNIICKITEGVDYSVYSLYELIRVTKSKKYYLPCKPNDVHLFTVWFRALKQTALVEFRFSTTIKSLQLSNSKNKVICVKDTQSNIYKGDNVILAMPPDNFISILESSDGLMNTFTSYNNTPNWDLNTKPGLYISLTFHWNTHVDLSSLVGWPVGSWDIFGFVMSDHMRFKDARSKTVFSLTILSPIKDSPTNNKPAINTPSPQLENEVWNQLSKLVDVSPPTSMVVFPGLEFVRGSWIYPVTTFTKTMNSKGFNQQISSINNLYNCGTHNGLSSYPITSIETACFNAYYLSQRIIPKISDIT